MLESMHIILWHQKGAAVRHMCSISVDNWLSIKRLVYCEAVKVFFNIHFVLWLLLMTWIEDIL